MSDKICQYQLEATRGSFAGERDELRGNYADRCFLRPPMRGDSKERCNASRWILSGGGTLAFERCQPNGCKSKALPTQEAK